MILIFSLASSQFLLCRIEVLHQSVARRLDRNPLTIPVLKEVYDQNVVAEWSVDIL